ncbi:unnamed protein product [Chrysoparadoxa australica]
MTEPGEVEAGMEELLSFENALEHIEESLMPLTRVSHSEIVTLLAKDEAAKLNVALAYAAASLFYMHLRSKGVDPKNHPVKGELDRIQRYMVKLKSIQGLPQSKEDQRKITVDQAAAGRFIAHSLRGNVEAAKFVAHARGETAMDTDPR